MNSTQLRLYQVAEIKVTYHPKIPGGNRIQVRSSRNIYDIFMDFWDSTKIEYKEDFYAMYLNRANRIIGIHHHSSGGLSGTVVDTKQILGVGLKSNCSAIVLAHNHPSGNLNPSQADIDITKKIKKASKLMEITLLDHVIITSNGYYSFADEGQL